MQGETTGDIMPFLLLKIKGENTQKDKENKKHRYLLPFDDERLPESAKEYDFLDDSIKLQIAKEIKKMEEIYS